MSSKKSWLICPEEKKTNKKNQYLKKIGKEKKCEISQVERLCAVAVEPSGLDYRINRTVLLPQDFEDMLIDFLFRSSSVKPVVTSRSQTGISEEVDSL